MPIQNVAIEIKSRKNFRDFVIHLNKLDVQLDVGNEKNERLKNIYLFAWMKHC